MKEEEAPVRVKGIAHGRNRYFLLVCANRAPEHLQYRPVVLRHGAETVPLRVALFKKYPYQGDPLYLLSTEHDLSALVEFPFGETEMILTTE